uniref:Uncharacterized protein n=1 Tax=Amphiprion percula TaxID=161767 RepID=A0A3P8TG40_AMPPE
WSVFAKKKTGKDARISVASRNFRKTSKLAVKINRKKFDVLSRKSKHDVGLSVVSRSKAITKRKETCLKEYKQKNQYDTKMAPEDKILQRFTMERQRTHEKKDKLNEEDEFSSSEALETDSPSKTVKALIGLCSCSFVFVLCYSCCRLGAAEHIGLSRCAPYQPRTGWKINIGLSIDLEAELNTISCSE